ncbi:MAG: hypothetical protein LBR11_09130 [Deltaproteobacteria bacterium]|jgi:hypothetical protein|nr:hypothetical protein [Deltaproteobacteria bacterium]
MVNLLANLRANFQFNLEIKMLMAKNFCQKASRADAPGYFRGFSPQDKGV